MADFTPGPTGTDEVLFAVDGSLGRVLLNRPRAINSLTRDMVVAMRAQLEAWAEDPQVQATVGMSGQDPGAVFAEIRERKNRF